MDRPSKKPPVVQSRSGLPVRSVIVKRSLSLSKVHSTSGPTRSSPRCRRKVSSTTQETESVLSKSPLDRIKIDSNPGNMVSRSTVPSDVERHIMSLCLPTCTMDSKPAGDRKSDDDSDADRDLTTPRIDAKPAGDRKSDEDRYADRDPKCSSLSPGRVHDHVQDGTPSRLSPAPQLSALHESDLDVAKAAAVRSDMMYGKVRPPFDELDEVLPSCLPGCTVSDDLDLTRDQCLPDADNEDAMDILDRCEDVTLKLVRTRMKTFLTWDRMMSLLCYSGRNRMTAELYQFFRQALQSVNGNVRLPSYRTTSSTHWSDIVRTCLPTSRICFLRELPRAEVPPTSTLTHDGKNRNPSDCVRLVLPSEWAKLDIMSLSFYKDVFEVSENTRPGVLHIENVPVVHHRRTCTGADVTLWAEYENAICPCEMGDVVQFPCNYSRDLSEDSAISSAWIRGTRQSQDGSAHELLIDAVLGYTWIVGQTSSAPNTEAFHDTKCELTILEKAVINIMRLRAPSPITNQHGRTGSGTDARVTQTTLRECLNPSELHLYPGDVCMLLRPETPSLSSYVCLFVGSPVYHAKGGCAERLVWVRPHERDVERNTTSPYIYVQLVATVRAIPLWLRGRRVIPTFSRASDKTNMGTLSCGRRFLIYRFAIYTDGFKQHKSLSDVKSVDGCYLLPLGRGMESRKSAAACRILSLTPHGHSSNDVLRLIQDDLLVGATTGFDSFDPYGRPVRIFLDVVAMFGDYPALTATSDLRGHNGLAFCSFCTYREHPSAVSGSKLHTTQWHSRRLGAMRTDIQRDMIRPELNDAELQQLLGFSKMESHVANELPMVQLARKLRNVTVRVRDRNNRFILPAGFDSAQSLTVAPDHLISGLIDNTLAVCFAALTNHGQRQDIQVRMITDAISNGLRQEGTFLRWNDRTFIGIRRLSMSTRICMLLCAVQPFIEMYKCTSQSVFLLPHRLQAFVASIYHVPSVEVEGSSAKRALSDLGAIRVRGDQLRAAREYSRLAAAFHRQDPVLGKFLNKPNMHRSIELCVHTITAFGHVGHCSEMVLEMTHRRFKSWLETNAHIDAHITGVERAIFTDWQGRVATLVNLLRFGDTEEKVCASRGLRRLFLGEQSSGIEESTVHGRAFTSSFNEAVLAAMSSPVLDGFEKAVQVNDLDDRVFSWEVFMKDSGTAADDDTVKAGRHILMHWYSVHYPGMEVVMCQYNHASYISSSRFGGRRRSYPHLTIRRNTGISIVSSQSVRDRDVFFGEKDLNMGVVWFFAVYGILRMSTGDIWCISRELRRGETGFSVHGSRPVVVQLGPRVRRVALFQIFDKGCNAGITEHTPKQSATICDGGVYKVVDRQGGYPPHLG